MASDICLDRITFVSFTSRVSKFVRRKEVLPCRGHVIGDTLLDTLVGKRALKSVVEQHIFFTTNRLFTLSSFRFLQLIPISELRLFCNASHRYTAAHS